MTVSATVPAPALDKDPNLSALLEHLQRRYNEAICCTLVYGSCLRSGDIYDGLLDLYLLCDDYRSAYQRRVPAAANWLLPPNVFYAEQQGEQRTLRSKVTVISLQDFSRGCSPAWFESYIWGRFAQPTHILYCRNHRIRAQVETALLEAAHTLLLNALPALPARGSVSELWQQALALSYSTELRTERSGRARELAESAMTFYTQLTRYHADSPALHMAVYDGDTELQYETRFSRLQRLVAAGRWPVRRVQGKMLSITRLVKALFTFEGGLDYIAWKLERHSGEEVVIPDRVRRAPLIFLWGFFWSLYRRGIFK